MESISHLFSQKSIDEVLDFEKKNRNDIELKKEELRQMVGERYRDLIEAADTISEMKICSSTVKASVNDLQQFCKTKSFCKNKPISLVKKKSSFKAMSRYMEIAAQTKILMEMPEKIWSHVEAGQMVIAALLYLQSLEVLKNLSLDGATSYSAVLLWFPMLGQQAQAIGNLRNAILKESRILSRDHLLQTERLAEALCAIAILEKSTAAESLEALLKARLSVLQSTFSDEESYSKDRVKNVGAKAKICSSVTIVRKTILQIFDLFCESDGGGGMIATLLGDCNGGHDAPYSLLRNDSSKLWTKHLPKEVACSFEFSPKDLKISLDMIRSSCTTWFTECELVLSKGIQDSLKFTVAAKDLASIRTDLMEVLGQNSGKNTESMANPDDYISDFRHSAIPSLDEIWSKACKTIFEREIFLWNDVLSKLFLEKLTLLVDDTFEKLFESSKTIFSSAPETPVAIKNMSTYIWQEHDSDIVGGMAWNQWQIRKQKSLSDQGGLSLKVATVTPDIRSACDGINQIMSQMLNDMNFCIPGLVDQQLRNSPAIEYNFDETEVNVVTCHLRNSCYRFLNNLTSHISKLGSDLKKSESSSSTFLDNILHLSLLCRNFFDLCHSFKFCCYQKEDRGSLKRQFSTGIGNKTILERSKSVDSTWNEIVNTMLNHSHTLMAIWCRAVLADGLKPYKKSLLASALNRNLLKSIATWDSLTVEEENESGDKVTSQIKVPAAATWHTVQFLYFLSSELNRVGGYSTSRFTLHHFSKITLLGVYEVFSEARRTFSVGEANLHGQSRSSGASATPSQTWALQCLFDLRYLHSLLYQPSISLDEDEKEAEEEDEENSSYTFSELVDWLEGYVDPFDLDVFSPYITRNLQRYVSRTCVMFGMLCSPEKLSSSSQKFAASTKDSHNVMPLAPDCGRFSYLPVSGRTGMKRASQGIDRTLARQLPLASALRDLTRDSIGANEKQSGHLTSSLYSKLGALSSSWLSSSPLDED